MKISQWGLMLIPALTWAQMSISTTEQVSELMIPDVLQGNLGFEEQDKSSERIKEHLNAIIREVKRVDPKAEYCRGGGYHISPRYSYKEQKQEFMGYSGTLGFTCTFETIEPYNTLTSGIDRVSASGVRKSQGALQWRVSDKKLDSTRVALRNALLRKAAVQAESFSQETGMMCTVAAVRMGEAPSVMPMQIRSVAMMESVPTQSPMRSDEEAVLQAAVDYNCSKPLR